MGVGGEGVGGRAAAAAAAAGAEKKGQQGYLIIGRNKIYIYIERDI